MFAVVAIGILAVVVPPVWVLARRVRRGPAVLRWEHGKGWIATYQRLR